MLGHVEVLQVPIGCRQRYGIAVLSTKGILDVFRQQNEVG